MTALLEIKQSALEMFDALDDQYRDGSNSFNQQMLDDVINYIQPHLSGATKNFAFEGQIIFINKEEDKVLKDGKFSGYFQLVEFDTILKTEIVIGRNDIYKPEHSFIYDIDHILHEYGHFQSLINWCMENHPNCGDILESKSGMKYAPCYDIEAYRMNEARQIFHEEVMACRFAVQTVEKLPITEKQKLILMKFVKDSSAHTLQVYAKNVDTLIEREKNNVKNSISEILPIKTIPGIHTQFDISESLSAA